VIVSERHPPGMPGEPQVHARTKRRPGGRATSIDLIKTLYAQAPHATLHAPYCTLQKLLSGCQYLVSTDGQRLSAAVAYTDISIEFTWSLAGRAETLRNLIAQVQNRLASLAFAPVMETGRRSWGEMLGLPVQGRYFRAYLPDPAPQDAKIPAGFQIAVADPTSEAAEISRLMNAAYPSLPRLTTPERLGELASADYYLADGWFFLIERDTGQRVGLAICGYCPEMKEGFIEWIQVVPRLRNQGFGRLLVHEAIRRIHGQSRFITASGNLDAPFALGGLYKACGFVQIRQWTILGQGAATANRELPFLALLPPGHR
jgi:GNAT superfamily N-acetyltransferase